MSYKRFFITSAAALAIGLAGTVFAGPPPVSDAQAQEKTTEEVEQLDRMER